MGRWFFLIFSSLKLTKMSTKNPDCFFSLVFIPFVHLLTPLGQCVHHDKMLRPNQARHFGCFLYLTAKEMHSTATNIPFWRNTWSCSRHSCRWLHSGPTLLPGQKLRWHMFDGDFGRGSSQGLRFVPEFYCRHWFMTHIIEGSLEVKLPKVEQQVRRESQNREGASQRK